MTDGCGGLASGTAAGLRTRRYHGLLVPATEPPIGRMMALAALDPVIVIGDNEIQLGVHEWVSGAVSPAGHEHLVSFVVEDGLPRWRWEVGGIVLERRLAMVRGRPAVGVVHRLLHCPGGSVRLRLEALCTWRDAHGERSAAGEPQVEVTADGLVFEGKLRLAGPGYVPGGLWYTGARYREETARSLDDHEDLWFAGSFEAELGVGESVGVTAWAGNLADSPAPAAEIVENARIRAASLASKASTEPGRALAVAADQFVVTVPSGLTVVAGYPWFGDWSRDTMTSYEGLFLLQGRFDEGRSLLQRAAASLSEGMLANTADVGGTEYNTVDATLWFLHAVHRHVSLAGDADLAMELLPVLLDVVRHHVAGTRYGIRVDGDGLLTQGSEAMALTWMDARIDGVPVTQRAGKPVEVNALWVNGLAGIIDLCERFGGDAGTVRSLEATARASFVRRFPRPGGAGCYDVIDGPLGDDTSVRPNQLLAVSLPFSPIDPVAGADILRACEPLLTPLGLRSLTPADSSYLGRHRGSAEERDHAYHEGTVWPWLIGPYMDACRRLGVDGSGLVESLVSHISDFGVGSVSETADGDAPHACTGSPFQAWSVAELARVLAAL